jgi:sulfoxide reductase catalytic subunit YedY
MHTRRQLLKWLTGLFLWTGTTIGLGFSGASKLWAAAKKRILPKNTDMNSLRNENPEFLDTRNLQVMPLDAFETMGDKDAPFTPEAWRLEVAGAVQESLALTYSVILALPAIEREVLLVCPGVFVNHGKWKGIAFKELMQRARPAETVSKVHIYARSRYGDRKETFSFDDVKSGRVFLAYSVNNQTLPRKHGYPLRVVAEGHWGSHWAKYVYRVEFI